MDGPSHPAKYLIPLLVLGCLGFGFWVGAEAGAPLPVDRSLLDGVAEDRVAIGTMTLTTRHSTYLGTLVYARLPAADADAQLDYYLNRTGAEPDAVENALCLQNCEGAPASNVTGRDKLFEDLERALGDMETDLGVDLEGLSSARLGTPEGEVVYIVFGMLADRALTVAPGEVPALDDVRTRLLRACTEAQAAGNFSLPAGIVSCQQLYVRFSVDADWDTSLARFVFLERPERTNVLGPLTWSTTTAAETADPNATIERAGVLGLASDLTRGEHTGPLYMPWSAIVFTGLALVPGLFWNVFAASRGYRKVLPMVLLSSLVAGVTLVLIRYGYSVGPSPVFIAAMFLALYIPAYRYYKSRPAGWIDYFSWLLVILGLSASVLYTLWQFDRIPLDTNLVPRLYTGLLEVEAASILRIAMKIYLATLALAIVVLIVLYVFARWEVRHAKRQWAQTQHKPLRDLTTRELYDMREEVGPAGHLLLAREVRARMDRTAMTRPEPAVLPDHIEKPQGFVQQAYAPLVKGYFAVSDARVRKVAGRTLLARGDEPTREDLAADFDVAQSRLEGWRAG